MPEKAKYMEPVENVLPEGFNGTFEFTNWTDEDFTDKWGGIAYTYPANRTSPMVIMNATPLEIQQIRKKFAKTLAEREFFKSKKYEALRSREGMKDENGVVQPRLMSFQSAGVYTLGDLTQNIQRCLEPLPIARAKATTVPKRDTESELSRDEEGDLNTVAVRERQPLKLKEKAAK